MAPQTFAQTEELLLSGHSPRRVLERLSQEGVTDLPSLRTVADMAAAYRTNAGSDAWSVMTADAEEAALVLPVLAELLRRSGFETFALSQPIARRIARVRGAAPWLQPFEAFRFAARYEAGRENPTRIDAQLAQTYPGHSETPRPG